MTYAVGDRVRFLGVNVEAPERMSGDIDGTQGAWVQLVPGLAGTVMEVIPDDESGTGRLFVDFDAAPSPLNWLAELLGQTTGWPILESEVEALVPEAA